MAILPNRPGSTCLWVGTVERIDSNGVGWGDAEGVAQTFDFPMPQGYGIGSRVEMYEKDKPEADEGDLLIVVLHETGLRVTICQAIEMDDGYEIIGCAEFSKPETQQ